MAQGCTRFDPETKQFRGFQYSPANRNSLSTNVVRSLMVDDKNNLYIGTYAGGMNYLDTKTMRFHRYLHDSNDPASISTNHVWSLLQDSEKAGLCGAAWRSGRIPARKKDIQGFNNRRPDSGNNQYRVGMLVCWKTAVVKYGWEQDWPEYIAMTH